VTHSALKNAAVLSEPRTVRERPPAVWPFCGLGPSLPPSPRLRRTGTLGVLKEPPEVLRDQCFRGRRDLLLETWAKDVRILVSARPVREAGVQLILPLTRIIKEYEPLSRVAECAAHVAGPVKSRSGSTHRVPAVPRW